MAWGYRVVLNRGGFRLFEVYGDEEAPEGWCEATPSGDTLEELREDLQAMLEAIPEREDQVSTMHDLWMPDRLSAEEFDRAALKDCQNTVEAYQRGSVTVRYIVDGEGKAVAMCVQEASS